MTQRYMNMKDFAKYIGMSYYTLRLRYQHQLPVVRKGRNHLVDVEPALAILASIDGIEALVSKNGLALLQEKQR